MAANMNDEQQANSQQKLLERLMEGIFVLTIALAVYFLIALFSKGLLLEFGASEIYSMKLSILLLLKTRK